MKINNFNQDWYGTQAKVLSSNKNCVAKVVVLSEIIIYLREYSFAFWTLKRMKR